MSGWTIHSTHGQLDPRECIRFNLCQERQSASWVPFHPTHELFCSCSLQYSEPSLASVLYSLLRVLFCFLLFFFFYHLSLLGILGPPFPLLWVLSFPRLFLLWLNTLHKPEATVTLLVKNQERRETREEEGSTVSYHSWKAQFPQKARSTLPGPAPRRALPASDLWGCEVPTGSGERGCLPEVWFGNCWWAQRDFCTRSFTYPQVEPTMSEIMIKKKIKIRIDFKMG